MKSKFLLLLGALLYLASPAICQNPGSQPAVWCFLWYCWGSNGGGSGGKTTSTASASATSTAPAPATPTAPASATSTSSASAASTASAPASSSEIAVITISGRPVTVFNRPSVPATTTVFPIPSATISGKLVSTAFTGEVFPLPAGPASTPSATATPTRSRAQLKKLIIDALDKVRDIELFAGLVKANTDIFELLNPESNYTIFAPNNAAMRSRNGVKKRQGGGVSVDQGMMFFERGGDQSLASGPRTLKTAIKDPRYVNLGPGEAARVVSLPADGKVRVVSGMGSTATVEEREITFEAGAIVVVETFFTYPRSLSETLRSTDGTQFEKTLSSLGGLEVLSNFPGITLFALTDQAVAAAGDRLTNTSLSQHISLGFVGYTPEFAFGRTYNMTSGGEIEITMVGKDYFVNGVKIVKSDVIMTNGVVHYVEDIIGPYTGPPPSPPSPSPSTGEKGNTAGRSAISPLVTILAIVAGLMRYCLMT